MKDAGQFAGDDFPNLADKRAGSAALKEDACFALFPGFALSVTQPLLITHKFWLG